MDENLIINEELIGGNMEKMAILTVGFDGYSDLWDDFFYLLNKYWKDKSYSTYLVNNTLKKNYEGVKVINCGLKAEWSKKLQKALSEIDEEYVCLLLEDFFIGDFIDSEEIKKILNFIEKEQIIYYKLTNFSEVNTSNYKNINYLHALPKELKYGVSLQAAIWKKDFLNKLIGNQNYNAWKFEADRLDENDNITEDERSRCIFDNRNILNIQHGVVQGHYLPEVIKYFNNQNYSLNLAKRDILSGRKLIKYRLKKMIYNYTPDKYRKNIKKIGEKLGVEFVSTKYSK